MPLACFLIPRAQARGQGRTDAVQTRVWNVDDQQKKQKTTSRRPKEQFMGALKYNQERPLFENHHLESLIASNRLHNCFRKVDLSSRALPCIRVAGQLDLF